MSTTLTAPPKEQATSAPTDAAPREYRWTVESTYRADAARAFKEPLYVELVHGRLIEHSEQTPRHAYTVAHMATRFRDTLEPQLNVQEHRPMFVASDTETNTDILVFTGNKRGYWQRHPSPSDVALLVEVADISAEYDTEEKAQLYSEVGVQEYWVALTEMRTLLVHRMPTTDGYESVVELGLSERVAPLALPDRDFTVRDLLGIPAEEIQPKRNGSSRQKHDRPAPHEVHWTADAFDRACDVGVFGPEARLELIHGRIWECMGQGPLHFWLRVRVGRLLRAVLEPHFLIVDECPVRIAFDGQPIADVAALVESEGDDKRSPTSEDVALLVEVAVSSAEDDLGDKALLYAQAGIGDYWVVLPEKSQIIVHRAPSPNGFVSVTTRGVGEAISPLAAPDAVLAVAVLLGQEYENA